MGPDELVARLATAQRGIVTTSQLRACGLTDHAIRSRVGRGLLHRRHRGVLAVGHLADIPLGAQTAALLACGDGSALSHRSAAVFWQLLPERRGDPVVVTVPRERNPKHDGIQVHRPMTFPHSDVWTRDGLRVTSPRRTLVDLAAVGGVAELRTAYNEAHARALIHPDHLHIPAGARGAAKLEAVKHSHTGPTLSGGERRFVALIRKAGLPSPETNVTVAGVKVDALWRTQRIAVEVDHWSTRGHPTAFERDPRRDLKLRQAGFDPIRVTTSQVDDDPFTVVALFAQRLGAG